MSAATTAFPAQLATVRQSHEDFEWYPTTNEIIEAMKTHIFHDREENYRRNRMGGFLDIGAGNGKVLDAIADLGFGERYAIEKSSALLNLLPPEVFILGVDFWKTTLYDKSPGTIFSNPPYSEFKQWSAKIICEAPVGSDIYLVIPVRWEDCLPISREIEARQAKVAVIGTYSFEAAEDRKARATVHLLHIHIPEFHRSFVNVDGDEVPPQDPFERFFDENFAYPERPAPEKPFKEQLEETQLVGRRNFIEALCILHDARIEKLRINYAAICTLDHALHEEFGISRRGLIESLSQKLGTTKKEYWKRLFDGMEEISRRLTVQSRRNIQELLNSQTGIDFNRENAYAIVLWTVRNANKYFDSQLIDTYEKLVCYANVDAYVSNTRIFKKDRFRYDFVKDEDHTHYRLKVGHRMVLQSCGGLKRESYSRNNGLCETAANFLSDLITIAENLGFNVLDSKPYPGEWDDSSAREYRFSREGGKAEVLFRVRAFQNWNMHMQFHPDFIHALNVQHGRLEGWLRNDGEAASELEIPPEVASKFFDAAFRISPSNLAITHAPGEEPKPEPSSKPTYEAPEMVQDELLAI
jgi:hypothetical protein